MLNINRLDAYTIAAIALYSTGHWIGGSISLILMLAMAILWRK